MKERRIIAPAGGQHNRALTSLAGWQHSLRNAVDSVDELLSILEIEALPFALSETARRQFPLKVPREYVARMARGEPNDPLLQQVLPRQLEELRQPGFETDPVGDHAALMLPGLLRKYHGRVLLLPTGGCAIHCRYCFRRHFPYGSQAGMSEWRQMVAAIAADPEIREVILSGGDPLVIPDALLAERAAELARIPQLSTLRIHTRLPVVLPNRVDDRLIDWLGSTALHKVVVLHINHANEIDDAVREALGRLRAIGVTLLNQSVLLKGVNSTVESLVELSRCLFDAGVLPYYLHLLDRVQGAAHFEVAEPEALNLMSEVAAQLPGYLVPALVREEPGAPGKSSVHG